MQMYGTGANANQMQMYMMAPMTGSSQAGHFEAPQASMAGLQPQLWQGGDGSYQWSQHDWTAYDGAYPDHQPLQMHSTWHDNQDVPPQLQMAGNGGAAAALAAGALAATSVSTMRNQKKPNSSVRQRRGGAGRRNASYTESFSNATTCSSPRGLSSEDDRSDGKSSEDEAAQAIADDLLRQLREGADGQWRAMMEFQRLAFLSQAGSKGAQAALQQGTAEERQTLASGLKGHVYRAVQSKHANYAVQKIIEVLPVAKTSFIPEELLGFGKDASMHPFACRVIC